MTCGSTPRGSCMADFKSFAQTGIKETAEEGSPDLNKKEDRPGLRAVECESAQSRVER